MSRVDRASRILSLAGVVFLAFVLGAWVAWGEGALFRSGLRPSFIGLTALLRNLEEPERQDHERIPHHVVTLDAARASAGLTLVVVGQGAHLLDLDGTIRHTWHLDYDGLRDGKELLAKTPREDLLHWRPARVLPNGDLLAVVALWGGSPEGLALVRMDRDSKPVWIYHGHVHHDFDVAPDGRIFVLGQAVRDRVPAEIPNLPVPFIDDRLLIVSAQGTLLREISIMDAFARSPYRTFVNREAALRRYTRGEYLHTNDVDLVSAKAAARFPFAREGQVLISVRDLSMLAVLDVDREQIVWARRGEWLDQHDPDFLENGNLLVYDNAGDLARGGRTRIIEYDPRTGAIVWQYPGPGGRDIFNRIRGDQQRLPNGDVLINDYAGRSLLEVTRGGDIVWELANGFALPGSALWYDQVSYTERYAPGALRFTFNEGRVAPR
ncbi:MAG: arylsulfotransferase family protein [Minicystis sp.]